MRNRILVLAALLLGGCAVGRAQVEDSVDVIDYHLQLDLSQGSPFKGIATLEMQLLRPCSTISLDFMGTVDSVEIDGVRIASPDLAALPTAGIVPGVHFCVGIWYTGRQYVESGGFGGFHFDADLHYNLACGFAEDPHVFGRVMYPCRDNFHDKATYTLRVKSKAGWSAECSGEKRVGEVDSTGCEHTTWRVDQPVCTYLIGVSQANWRRQQDTIHSLYGDYPLTMSYIRGTAEQVRNCFAQLDSVVPMFERCFGPYRWGRIGYIGTHNGSMEHVNNIALYESFMTSMNTQGQSTMAHELGHAWFGNLVTCSTEGDMWINEGGASFTSEVGMEAVHGRGEATDYYQEKLESVLRRTHLTDYGYRSLHGMDHDYTYGSTTYDKGWMVWHSLRGYLGDSLFYVSVRRLLASNAYGVMDAGQVRDSLSLYSGVDLGGFFQFHVFTPGFIDYQVWMEANITAGNEARVHIRQQGVGTDSLARSNRVPLTFFAANGDTVKRWIAFDDEQGDTVVALPFAPAFVVLDYDCDISDAATLGTATLEGTGRTTSMPVAHFNVRSSQVGKVMVEHHFAHPTGAMPEGVVRMANRYWVVNTLGAQSNSMQGQFHYLRTGITGSTYRDLDRGFYSAAATADSLALLYRANPMEEWRVVSRQRIGNIGEGYLVTDNLRAGQYTLAVVDPSQVGIGCADPLTAPSLFPNPLGKGEALTVTLPSEEAFVVTIFDAEGRQVWQKTGCANNQKLYPTLAKGTYLIQIENNFISLQSKLIQL